MIKIEEYSLNMGTFFELEKGKTTDSGFEFFIDVSLDSNNGVFRRYHVGNNPVNFVDPWGLCAENNKQQCIQNFLQQNYGNFVANTLVPQFSVISLYTNFASYVKGSAISLSVKGLLVGLPGLASKIATTTGKNLAAYPGMATASANALEAGAFWGTTTATAGSAIAVGLTGASSFATTAHAYAIWACRNVSD